jgi:hypothetical protein
MATISTCPKCSQLVTLPEGYGSSAPMRCPLCQAEYPLGEALATVPPELIPVVELAGAEAAESASPPSDAAADFLADLARLEQSYGEAPPAGDETAAEQPAPLESSPFSPNAAETSEEHAVTPVPGRHKRKPKSALRLLLETVIGGVAGLLIAYYALWWIQRDSCKLPRIPWLPFLPQTHSTDSGIDK